MVDLDGQAASSRWLGVEEDNRLAEALKEGKGLSPIPDVAPGVWLAPASGKLDSIAHDLRPTQGGQLRRLLSKMTEFDFIFIDCPPSLGNRLIGNALLAATHAIVPVETSILALDGLRMLLTTLNDVREGLGHEIILAGVLACRYDARTKLSSLVLAELRRALPGKVFETTIRENVRMRECPASGQSILAFAPDSHAAVDYRALAEEILEKPEIWLKPAGQADQIEDSVVTEEESFSVDGLRAQTAAKVRVFAQKASWRKPVAANSQESPSVTEQPTPQDEPCEQAEPSASEAPDAVPPTTETDPRSMAALTESLELAHHRIEDMQEQHEASEDGAGEAQHQSDQEGCAQQCPAQVPPDDQPPAEAPGATDSAHDPGDSRQTAVESSEDHSDADSPQVEKPAEPDAVAAGGLGQPAQSPTADDTATTSPEKDLPPPAFHPGGLRSYADRFTTRVKSQARPSAELPGQETLSEARTAETDGPALPPTSSATTKQPEEAGKKDTAPGPKQETEEWAPAPKHLLGPTDTGEVPADNAHEAAEAKKQDVTDSIAEQKAKQPLSRPPNFVGPKESDPTDQQHGTVEPTPEPGGGAAKAKQENGEHSALRKHLHQMAQEGKLPEVEGDDDALPEGGSGKHNAALRKLLRKVVKTK